MAQAAATPPPIRGLAPPGRDARTAREATECSSGRGRPHPGQPLPAHRRGAHDPRLGACTSPRSCCAVSPPSRVPWANMFEFTLTGTGDHRRRLPGRPDLARPAVPRCLRHRRRRPAARRSRPSTSTSSRAAAAAAAVGLARHPRLRRDARHRVLRDRRRALDRAAAAGAARGRQDAGMRFLRAFPTLGGAREPRPTAWSSSGSRSGPSPSSPARSGPSARGAATGAGTPRRSGPSSSGWSSPGYIHARATRGWRGAGRPGSRSSASRRCIFNFTDREPVLQGPARLLGL